MNIGPLFIGLFAFPTLLILIIFGVHIGLALGLVGFIGLILVTGSFHSALPILLSTPYNAVVKFNYIIIPLFILMGTFAYHGGFGESLYKAFAKIAGRISGGLLIATTGACLLFGACSGSNLAAAALFAKISLPELNKRGFNKKFSVGAIVCSSMLTAVMPPSILLVIYGILVEQPIGRLLIAGVIPSVVFAVGISLFIWLAAKRSPDLCPTETGIVPWREKIASLKGTWAIVALAVIVLGGIYSGVFSPTEAAAAGSLASCMFCIMARKLNFGSLQSVLFETLEITVMLFFVLIGAAIFSRFLAMSGFSSYLVNSLIALELPRAVLLAGVMLIYVFLGCFIDNISIMAITLPIVFPAISAQGYDGVWFGIILLIAMLIGAMTPPFGLSIFAVKSVVKTEITIEDMFRGTMPFIIMSVVIWLILIIFPQISLFLPNLILTR